MSVCLISQLHQLTGMDVFSEVGTIFFIRLWMSSGTKTNSACELYRQGGRRRSAKLVPTFADRGVSRGQRNGSPQPLISVF